MTQSQILRTMLTGTPLVAHLGGEYRLEGQAIDGRTVRPLIERKLIRGIEQWPTTLFVLTRAGLAAARKEV